MYIKMSPSAVILSLFMIISFFIQPLKLYFFPEIITIILAGYMILDFILYSRIPKLIFKIFIAFFLLILIGLVGNYNSGIARSAQMIFMDVFYVTKVFICFCGSWLLFKRIYNKKQIITSLGKISKLIVLISFAFLIINLIFDIGMSDDIRYGIPSFKFIFESSGWLNQYWVLIIILQTAELQYSISKKNIFFIILSLIIWIFTLRSRAFVMVVIYCVFYIWLMNEKNIKDYGRRLFQFKNIIIAIILIVAVGYDQIENYFLGPKVSARSLLLTTSIKIMRDFFPFGTGLATYGTEMAREYYSPIYYRYGLNNFWALQKGGSELTDCYWPAIGGEFGILGIILMVFIISIVFRECLSKTRRHKFIFMSVALYLIYLLISSTATGIFTSDVTAMYMIFIGLFVSGHEKVEMEGK